MMSISSALFIPKPLPVVISASRRALFFYYLKASRGRPPSWQRNKPFRASEGRMGHRKIKATEGIRGASQRQARRRLDSLHHNFRGE
jgi:hypothetical protein